MTPTTLESLAKSGEPMPEGLNIGEAAYFQAFAGLTARFKAGKIAPDQSQREAAMIRNSWERYEAMQREEERIAQFWENVQDVSAAYAKNRTPETAEAMYRKIYNLL